MLGTFVGGGVDGTFGVGTEVGGRVGGRVGPGIGVGAGVGTEVGEKVSCNLRATDVVTGVLLFVSIETSSVACEESSTLSGRS